MYPRFKTNLIGLAVALSFILVGFGLGEPPRLAHSPMPGQGALDTAAQVEAAEAVRPARRGALLRHLSMPYVSFAALTPRQES